MNTQFKRGILEICVLALLAENDQYGYAIIHALSQHIDVGENTVYPILRRLTKEGYTETYLTESKAGAPRKYYTMTKLGFAHYMKQRDEWSAFLAGVYQILNRGGKKHEDLYRRFKARTEKTTTE